MEVVDNEGPSPFGEAVTEAIRSSSYKDMQNCPMWCGCELLNTQKSSLWVVINGEDLQIPPYLGYFETLYW